MSNSALGGALKSPRCLTATGSDLLKANSAL